MSLESADRPGVQEDENHEDHRWGRYLPRIDYSALRNRAVEGLEAGPSPIALIS